MAEEEKNEKLEEEGEEEEIDPLERNKSYFLPEFEYFRKKYWNKRYKIFSELYNILYDNNKSIKDTEIKNEVINDLDDTFSDIKEDMKTYFECFENQRLKPISINIDNDNKNSKNEKENEEKNNKTNINFENEFLLNSRELIFKNYLKNYVKKKYKFSNNEFTLSVNSNQHVFFQINNIKIFEINYLTKIKLGDNIEEWVCNSVYGLYLLYEIKKYIKPYPVYQDDKIDDIEIKTISNENDFDAAISNGINEFEDLYLDKKINLDDIIYNINTFFNLDLLISNSPYYKFLNINILIDKKGNYKFLDNLFAKKNYLEEYTYIFGSKNYFNTYNILDNLINIYKKHSGRFLYLDLDYITNLKEINELKQYLAFWLPRAFFNEHYDQYKSFFLDIVDSIKLENLNYIIKRLIEFTQKIYKIGKLFIILNNVNTEKSHKFIENIKKSSKR